MIYRKIVEKSTFYIPTLYYFFVTIQYLGDFFRLFPLINYIWYSIKYFTYFISFFKKID